MNRRDWLFYITVWVYFALLFVDMAGINVPTWVYAFVGGWTTALVFERLLEIVRRIRMIRAVRALPEAWEAYERKWHKESDPG